MRCRSGLLAILLVAGLLGLNVSAGPGQTTAVPDRSSKDSVVPAQESPVKPATANAPSTTPEDRGAAYERSQRLEIEGKWKEAALAWESIKGDAAALYAAAMAWESDGDSDRAKRDYLKVVEQFPRSPEAGKSRFALALMAQKAGDFEEMESRLLWFLLAPKETERRPESLWLLGGHYLSTRADRWAAYGCFEILRHDYPTHESLRMAVSTWKQIERKGDLALWAGTVTRWRRVGLVPDRIPLFLLRQEEQKQIRQRP